MKDIPGYVFGPLRRCLDSIFIRHRLLHLSVDGLRVISKRPEMVERLISLTVKAGQKVEPSLHTDLERAIGDAAFTKNEHENDYPLLHAYTLVGDWGALEAGVEDMLIGILVNEPKVLERDCFAKIKIPLAKYELLDKEERMRVLLTDFQRTQSSGLAQGADTFENVLQAFELSDSVDKPIKSALWEMNHLRNVVVHRNSRADLRLVEACPSLNLRVGDAIFITHEQYSRYASAVIDYVRALLCRLGKRYDAQPPDWALPGGLTRNPIAPLASDKK